MSGWLWHTWPRFRIKVTSGLKLHRLRVDKTSRLNLYQKTDRPFYPACFLFLISSFLSQVTFNLQNLSFPLSFSHFFSCVAVMISFSQHCHKVLLPFTVKPPIRGTGLCWQTAHLIWPPEAASHRGCWFLEFTHLIISIICCLPIPDN